MKTFQEWLLKESIAEKNSEGLYLCPDCHTTLSYMSSFGRDRETMGGYGVEYAQCDKCKQTFEIVHGIKDEIFQSDFPYKGEE